MVKKEVNMVSLFGTLSVVFGCIGYLFAVLGFKYGYMGCGLGLFCGVFGLMQMDEDKLDSKSCLVKIIIGIVFSIMSLINLLQLVSVIL